MEKDYYFLSAWVEGIAGDFKALQKSDLARVALLLLAEYYNDYDYLYNCMDLLYNYCIACKMAHPWWLRSYKRDISPVQLQLF